MAGVSVSCPNCGSALRLPDRSLLGRKGKCPKCAHRFVLTAPGPKAATTPPPPKTPPQPAAPLTGTSARWIPDQPAADSDIPVFPLADQVASTPQRRPTAAPTPSPTAVPATPAASAPDAGDESTELFNFADTGPAPAVTGTAAETPAAPATTRYTRQRRRSWMPHILMGIGTAVTAGIIIGGVMLKGQSETRIERPTPPAVNQQWEAERQSLASSNEQALALSPTSGEAIPLNYLPFTPHLICHVRPGDLWQRERSLAEFQATLGDVGIWLTGLIQTMSRFEPEEIEELTFAVNFGPRTSTPDVAAVVRLREPQTQSDLFRRFNGQLRPDLDGTVYESGDLSFLLIDERTFTAASTTVIDSLPAAKDYPALPPADLEPLLKVSDRQRHLTLLFDVTNIDIHREFIFRQELQPLADQFVLWLGKEIESVSWSLHLEPNLYMETLLRQSNGSSALKVQRHMRLQLDRLPEKMLDLAELMRPGTHGSRQMVGRYPAMLQAVSMATSVDVAGQYVRCVTLLPQKAAANLAAASLLTWNQSVVTDFSTAVAVTQTPQLPATVAERLNLPVIVDFRNTPLEEVAAYLADDLQVEFVIDGDALMKAGFTQNMPQTFNLGTVPAKTALHAILQQYIEERDPMVISVDEDAKRVTITTRAKATQTGLAEFDTAE